MLIDLFKFSDIVNHKLFRNSFVYTGSNIIRNAIPFLLLPVLTHYLTPTDYGVVATFEVLLAIAIVFVSLSMHGAVAVNFFQIENHTMAGRAKTLTLWDIPDIINCSQCDSIIDFCGCA